MTREHTPIEAALVELDRRSRDRWIVVVVVVVGVLAAASLLALDVTAPQRRVWIVGALAAVVLLYLVSVLVEERRMRRAVQALVAERGHAAALETRVRALEMLHAAVRDVEAAPGLPEVFSRLVDAALRLTGARAGAVLLRVGDTLTVAAGAGPGSPERGTELPRAPGPAWAAVRTGEPVVSGRGAEWGSHEGGGSVAAPMRLRDRIVGAVVVEQDAEASPLTDADRLAVELLAEHAALAVRNATRREEEADRIAELEDELASRSGTAAGIVHDLRAPVAAVTGFAQLLLERGEELGPQRHRRLVEDVLAELERLRRMLDDLLAALSVEAGRTAPALDREVDLVGVVEAAARTGRGLATRLGGDREIVVHAPERLTVRGDELALVRAATNLLENAVRFAPPGSRVQVEVERTDDEAVLRVRDHGPGPGGEGAAAGGLGLQVVRTLVAAHGGTVDLDPADGGGALAEIRLPCR